MSADTITSLGPGSGAPDPATVSDNLGGGAGRGGSDNTPQGPLVVVQQPRSASPPRPAPRPQQGNADNSLRNGYAAISHSVSGETAAVGLGFLVAGPVGAIVGGAALPVLVAASMWRARRQEHDQNTNDRSNTADRNGAGRNRSGSGSGGGGGRHNSGGQHRTPGSGAGRGPKTPHGPKNRNGIGPGNGTGTGGGNNRKPKVKDPVADKLNKLGKRLGDKLKTNKTPKDRSTSDKAGHGKDRNADASGSKTPKNDGGAKGLKDGLRDGMSGLKPKDRGKQPASERPWRGRGTKTKKDRTRNGGTSTATSRDGLDPNKPKGPGGTDPEVFDAEIVDDGLDPKPSQPGPGDVIDGEVIDEDRIALVRTKREKDARRQAITAGKKAAATAAQDGTQGDPHTVQLDVIRHHNRQIDFELLRQDQLLALVAATEQRRRTPVSYPVAISQPAGTSTAGVAVARQIDMRASIAYKLLVAMAEQLANGLHNDDEADMADHVVELVGIPAMCRNLALAVREAANALQKTAPLHPSVIKHLNNAAVSALTAARMADTIITVFVTAHREDIYRVMEPRIGEDRWNIRNAAGTLDAAKLRAAILTSGQQRLALPAGSTPSAGSGKLVPASGDSTKKLVSLMKGFDRGHMVNCLSEVAGAAGGVETVAEAVTKLYRRMANTWPTEDVVDDTVRATASKVKNIAAELRKAIKAAQRAHQRDLRLNAKPRKGANAEKKWDVVRGRKG